MQYLSETFEPAATPREHHLSETSGTAAQPTQAFEADRMLIPSTSISGHLGAPKYDTHQQSNIPRCYAVLTSCDPARPPDSHPQDQNSYDSSASVTEKYRFAPTRAIFKRERTPPPYEGKGKRPRRDSLNSPGPSTHRLQSASLAERRSRSPERTPEAHAANFDRPHNLKTAMASFKKRTEQSALREFEHLIGGLTLRERFAP